MTPVVPLRPPPALIVNKVLSISPSQSVSALTKLNVERKQTNI